MKYSFIIMIVLLLSACKQNINEPFQFLTVNTDKSVYAPNQPIIISLHNDSESTAYFIHCNYQVGFFIEQKVNSIWSEKGSIAVVCLALYPMGVKELLPGMTYTDTITLADSGMYRLKYRFGWQQSNTWADSLFSNEFSVR
ncbi:hypothetical protein MUP95_10020 [bacterium]|nr:hypothetical protein [bacterium]